MADKEIIGGTMFITGGTYAELDLKDCTAVVVSGNATVGSWVNVAENTALTVKGDATLTTASWNTNLKVTLDLTGSSKNGVNQWKAIDYTGSEAVTYGYVTVTGGTYKAGGYIYQNDLYAGNYVYYNFADADTKTEVVLSGATFAVGTDNQYHYSGVADTAAEANKLWSISDISEIRNNGILIYTGNGFDASICSENTVSFYCNVLLSGATFARSKSGKGINGYIHLRKNYGIGWVENSYLSTYDIRGGYGQGSTTQDLDLVVEGSTISSFHGNRSNIKARNYSITLRNCIPVSGSKISTVSFIGSASSTEIGGGTVTLENTDVATLTANESNNYALTITGNLTYNLKDVEANYVYMTGTNPGRGTAEAPVVQRYEGSVILNADHLYIASSNDGTGIRGINQIDGSYGGTYVGGNIEINLTASTVNRIYPAQAGGSVCGAININLSGSTVDKITGSTESPVDQGTHIRAVAGYNVINNNGSDSFYSINSIEVAEDSYLQITAGGNFIVSGSTKKNQIHLADESSIVVESGGTLSFISGDITAKTVTVDNTATFSFNESYSLTVTGTLTHGVDSTLSVNGVITAGATNVDVTGWDGQVKQLTYSAGSSLGTVALTNAEDTSHLKTVVENQTYFVYDTAAKQTTIYLDSTWSEGYNVGDVITLADGSYAVYGANAFASLDDAAAHAADKAALVVNGGTYSSLSMGIGENTAYSSLKFIGDATVDSWDESVTALTIANDAMVTTGEWTKDQIAITVDLADTESVGKGAQKFIDYTGSEDPTYGYVNLINGTYAGGYVAGKDLYVGNKIYFADKSYDSNNNYFIVHGATFSVNDADGAYGKAYTLKTQAYTYDPTVESKEHWTTYNDCTKTATADVNSIASALLKTAQNEGAALVLTGNADQNIIYYQTAHKTDNVIDYYYWSGSNNDYTTPGNAIYVDATLNDISDSAILHFASGSLDNYIVFSNVNVKANVNGIYNATKSAHFILYGSTFQSWTIARSGNSLSGDYEVEMHDSLIKSSWYGNSGAALNIGGDVIALLDHSTINSVYDFTMPPGTSNTVGGQVRYVIKNSSYVSALYTGHFLQQKNTAGYINAKENYDDGITVTVTDSHISSFYLSGRIGQGLTGCSMSVKGNVNARITNSIVNNFYLNEGAVVSGTIGLNAENIISDAIYGIGNYSATKELSSSQGVFINVSGKNNSVGTIADVDKLTVNAGAILTLTGSTVTNVKDITLKNGGLVLSKANYTSDFFAGCTGGTVTFDGTGATDRVITIAGGLGSGTNDFNLVNVTNLDGYTCKEEGKYYYALSTTGTTDTVYCSTDWAGSENYDVKTTRDGKVFYNANGFASIAAANAALKENGTLVLVNGSFGDINSETAENVGKVRVTGVAEVEEYALSSVEILGGSTLFRVADFTQDTVDITIDVAGLNIGGSFKVLDASADDDVTYNVTLSGTPTQTYYTYTVDNDVYLTTLANDSDTYVNSSWTSQADVGASGISATYGTTAFSDLATAIANTRAGKTVHMLGGTFGGSNQILLNGVFLSIEGGLLNNQCYGGNIELYADTNITVTSGFSVWNNYALFYGGPSGKNHYGNVYITVGTADTTKPVVYANIVAGATQGTGAGRNVITVGDININAVRANVNSLYGGMNANGDTGEIYGDINVTVTDSTISNLSGAHFGSAISSNTKPFIVSGTVSTTVSDSNVTGTLYGINSNASYGDVKNSTGAVGLTVSNSTVKALAFVSESDVAGDAELIIDRSAISNNSINLISTGYTVGGDLTATITDYTASQRFHIFNGGTVGGNLRVNVEKLRVDVVENIATLNAHENDVIVGGTYFLNVTGSTAGTLNAVSQNVYGNADVKITGGSIGSIIMLYDGKFVTGDYTATIKDFCNLSDADFKMTGGSAVFEQDLTVNFSGATFGGNVYTLNSGASVKGDLTVNFTGSTITGSDKRIYFAGQGSVGGTTTINLTNAYFCGGASSNTSLTATSNVSFGDVVYTVSNSYWDGEFRGTGSSTCVIDGDLTMNITGSTAGKFVGSAGNVIAGNLTMTLSGSTAAKAVAEKSVGRITGTSNLVISTGTTELGSVENFDTITVNEGGVLNVTGSISTTTNFVNNGTVTIGADSTLTINNDVKFGNLTVNDCTLTVNATAVTGTSYVTSPAISLTGDNAKISGGFIDNGKLYYYCVVYSDITSTTTSVKINGVDTAVVYGVNAFATRAEAEAAHAGANIVSVKETISGGNLGGGTNVLSSGTTITANLYGGTSEDYTGNIDLTLNGASSGKTVLGGGSSLDSKVDGNINLTLAGATVDRIVYGGGQSGTVTGSITTTVTGDSKIGKNFYGGSLISSKTCGAYTAGAVNVNIEGGSFGGHVVGGSRLNGSDVTASTLSQTVASVALNVTGGTFNNKASIFAGGYVVGNGESNKNTDLSVTNGVTMTLNADVVTTNAASGIYGGALASSMGVATVSKGVSITVTGGHYSNIWGGGWAESNATSSVSGGVSINVTGGSIGNIFAGGNNDTSGAKANVTGSAVITLSGCTVNNVYASSKYGTSKITGSSKVTIGSDVTITGKLSGFNVNDRDSVVAGTEEGADGKQTLDLNASVSCGQVLGFDVCNVAAKMTLSVTNGINLNSSVTVLDTQARLVTAAAIDLGNSTVSLGISAVLDAAAGIDLSYSNVSVYDGATLEAHTSDINFSDTTQAYFSSNVQLNGNAINFNNSDKVTFGSGSSLDADTDIDLSGTTASFGSSSVLTAADDIDLSNTTASFGSSSVLTAADDIDLSNTTASFGSSSVLTAAGINLTDSSLSLGTSAKLDITDAIDLTGVSLSFNTGSSLESDAAIDLNGATLKFDAAEWTAASGSAITDLALASGVTIGGVTADWIDDGSYWKATVTIQKVEVDFKLSVENGTTLKLSKLA